MSAFILGEARVPGGEIAWRRLRVLNSSGEGALLPDWEQGGGNNKMVGVAASRPVNLLARLQVHFDGGYDG